jgi:type III secretion system-like peptide-binding chaperone
MNPAEVATALLIEQTLGDNHAYRKIDDRLYAVKQGSAYVMINVVPWGKDKAMLRCVSQLVKGVKMTLDLATQLLTLNAHLRFGSFSYDPVGDLILFSHAILGGTTLDPDELLATLQDVALIADEYDDKLAKKYGGQRMKDLLEEAAMERIIEMTPESFDFDKDN